MHFTPLETHRYDSPPPQGLVRVTAGQPLQYVEVAGGEVTVSPYVDLPLVEPSSAADQTGTPRGELLFVGQGLQPDSVRELVASCARPQPKPKTLRTLASLSRAEKVRARSNGCFPLSEDPCPACFQGTCGDVRAACCVCGGGRTSPTPTRMAARSSESRPRYD